MAKEEKDKKEEDTKSTKTKKTSKSVKHSLNEHFNKSNLSALDLENILLLNGFNQPIEEINIKLTDKEFENIVKDYLNKRL